jgi:hypothetical protein
MWCQHWVMIFWCSEATLFSWKQFQSCMTLLSLVRESQEVDDMQTDIRRMPTYRHLHLNLGHLVLWYKHFGIKSAFKHNYF